MASRRDELNAYSFARKRTNAAFLKPLPNGSIESAPRPLKAVLPSVLVGVLILVGFGACGILKPVAPKGWDEVGKNVIVGDESTTRYVVLSSKDANGKDQKLLHPVLNLASAKLLLDPKFQVVKVKESELDGKLAHGPAVGIPYAPDRLPGPRGRQQGEDLGRVQPARQRHQQQAAAGCVRPRRQGQGQGRGQGQARSAPGALRPRPRRSVLAGRPARRRVPVQLRPRRDASLRRASRTILSSDV